MYSTLGVNFLPKYVKLHSHTLWGTTLIYACNMSTLFVNKVVFAKATLCNSFSLFLAKNT